jgi:hypothetical protein
MNHSPASRKRDLRFAAALRYRDDRVRQAAALESESASHRANLGIQPMFSSYTQAERQPEVSESASISTEIFTSDFSFNEPRKP